MTMPMATAMPYSGSWNKDDDGIAQNVELVVRGTFYQLETAPSRFPFMWRHRSLELPPSSKIFADEADDVATVTTDEPEMADDGDESALSSCGEEEDDKEDVTPVQRYQTLDFDDLPAPLSVAVPVQHVLPVTCNMPSFWVMPHVASASDALDRVSISSGGSDFVPEPQLVAQQAARVSAVLMESEDRPASRTSKTGERQLETTVIFRNVPANYTRDMFVATLDAHGFFGKFDFVYLPFDWSTDVNCGFAFVNFVKHDDAVDVIRHFSGFRLWSMPSTLVCEVEWSKQLQGKSNLIHRFRNSSIMHASVPDYRKPILLRGGMRSEFPPAKRHIRQWGTF